MSRPLTDQLQCSIHNKRRTLRNLESDGMGGYRCARDSPCKVDTAMPNFTSGGCWGKGAGWGSQGGWGGDAAKGSWVAQGKGGGKNGWNAVPCFDGWDSMGSLNSGDGFGCGGKGSSEKGDDISCGGKGSSEKGNNSLAVESGDWLCPSCGDHQFKRNTVCRKCGTPNPSQGFSADQAVCSLHGKSRTAKNLAPDGMGGFKCKYGMECQTGGGGGGMRFSP